MPRPLWYAGFILLLIAALLVLPWQIEAMPALVASHFGPAGDANGQKTRDVYLVIALATTVGLPLLVVAIIALASRGSAPLLNVPNRAYWFAPERREAARAFMVDHAVRLAALLAAFLLGIHLLVVQANRQQPPQLPIPLVIGWTAVFLVGVGAWSFALRRRLRLPG